MTEDRFVSADNSRDDSKVKRDRWGRYKLPPPSNPDGKTESWTRATTFAKSVSDMFGLMKWQNRMVAKGLSLRDDLYAMASATDLEDKDTMDAIAEDAMQAAGSKSAAGLGTALHSFTEALDAGEEPRVPDKWKPCIRAYEKKIKEAGLYFPVWGIERIVCIETFSVAGTFDRVAQLKKDLTIPLPKGEVTLKAGTWVIVDVKTGKDLTYGWGDIAIQLALYSRADKIWNGSKGEYEPLPPISQDAALVIHLPANMTDLPEEKRRAELYGVDIQQGWQAAKLCEQVRDWRKNKTLARQVPLGEVRKATYVERIESAESREELSAIWREASKEGKWTKKLETLGQKRLAKLDS